MARAAAASEKKVLDENEEGAEGRKKRYTHTANNK